MLNLNINIYQHTIINYHITQLLYYNSIILIFKFHWELKENIYSSCMSIV